MNTEARTFLLFPIQVQKGMINGNTNKGKVASHGKGKVKFAYEPSGSLGWRLSPVFAS